MRIAVICNDTRGGVQPYVALASGLRDAGHDVRALAPVGLVHLFEGTGVRVEPLPLTHDADTFTASGLAERGTVSAMVMLARELPRRLTAWSLKTLEFCEGVDVMTGGVGGMTIGLAAAQKLGIPFVPTHLRPVGHPTNAFPGMLFPNLPDRMDKFGEHRTPRLSDLALWLPFRAAMASVRKKAFGLERFVDPTHGQVKLYGFSRHVVPMPQDKGHQVTGYWTNGSDEAWQPPADLADFLKTRRQVVSIGFGSMGSSDPEHAADMAIATAQLLGTKLIVLGGSRGLKTTNGEHVFYADAVQHEWLFPRVDAIVHHGGAGTTGAALMAGKPSIVVPFAVDQPFWASRVKSLGVGPEPIPRRDLRIRTLVSAVKMTLEDEIMRGKARDLGQMLRAEHGASVAASHFSAMA